MLSLTMRGSRARSLLLAPVLAAGLTVAVPAADAAAPARGGVYFGAAGDSAVIERKTGQDISEHNYGFFENKVESGRMLTVKFRNFKSWSATAALAPGSTGYQQIAQWGDTLKARGSHVILAFHHEAEATGNKKYGSAEQYKAAYRKVVSIIRSRGANNVSFAWQTTSYAFRADSGAYNAAAKWYPGDEYVDVVAPDPYNWHTCGHGRGKWQPLSVLVEDAVKFARARGKQVALAEFASVRDTRRPQWIRDAGSYLAANDDVFVAAYYFNRKPTNSANSECTWPLSSDADFAAMREVAAKASFVS